MPGQFIFVPLHPQKPEEERSRREHVSGGAEQELFRRWFLPGEVDNAQATQHHAGRGAAKDGEQSEVLQVDDGERQSVYRGTQFAEREMAAERAEESEEAATGKYQTGGVDQ